MVLFVFFSWTGFITHRRDGAQSFLPAAFLMTARTSLSSSLPLGTDVCPHPFLDEFQALLFLETLSSSMVCCSWRTKPHTSLIMSCMNLVCLLRCPWQPLGLNLFTFLVTLWAYLRPWPWGSPEPWLLRLNGCCGRRTNSCTYYTLTINLKKMFKWEDKKKIKHT